MGTGDLGTCSALLLLLLLLLCVVTGLSPSSAQSGSKQVQGILGESVTFPPPVFITGFLLHEDLGNIAVVFRRTADTNVKQKFKERLQWDKQTGLFTITQLQLQDEGQYKVDNSDGQKIITTFHLTVYERVSKPTEKTQKCTAVFSVENSRDVTLSWTRGEEILNQTSSPLLNTTLSLSLSLDIEEQDNGTYSCVASNPVSEESVQLNKTTCWEPPETVNTGVRYIPVIPAAALLVFPGVFAVFCIAQKLRGSVQDMQMK
ncbi:SLAM family member 5-like isoform X1 [Arapaima gigas]